MLDGREVCVASDLGHLVSDVKALERLTGSLEKEEEALRSETARLGESDRHMAEQVEQQGQQILDFAKQLQGLQQRFGTERTSISA